MLILISLNWGTSSKHKINCLSARFPIFKQFQKIFKILRASISCSFDQKSDIFIKLSVSDIIPVVALVYKRIGRTIDVDEAIHNPLDFLNSLSL